MSAGSNSMVETLATSTEKEWVKPRTKFHAHFDCFSGAAGDMMLAACLDASSSPEQLLQHVSKCLELGMPELKGEFAINTKRVWRGGMGSIAGLHVTVTSKYDHAPAPVPTPSKVDKQSSTATSHSHGHDHESSSTSAVSHIHNDEEQQNVERSHENGHSHENEEGGSDHNHAHSHSHGYSHDHSHSGSSLTPSSKAMGSPSTLQEDSHSHSHAHAHAQHGHSHGHAESGPLRNLPQIRDLIESAKDQYLTPWVKTMAVRAFVELAHAEAQTHGADSIESVHFHEVGAIDSIVDTVGTVLALDALGVTSVSCSRLPLGEGTVWTQHGLLPVPAPATLRLLVDMPTCPGPSGVTGELVTPTGAALLRALTKTSSDNGPSRKLSSRPPNFTIRQIGIGAGSKDFEKHPNVLRLLLGDSIIEKL